MKLVLVLIFLACQFALVGSGSSPKANLKANLAKAKLNLQDKNYVVEPRKFFIPLKKGYKVDYIITTPSYLAKTAIAVVNNGLANRVKILIYKMREKFAGSRKLIFGGMLKSDYMVKELSDKSYFYLVEIEMMEVANNTAEARVELIHGFKYPPWEDEKPHIDEGSKPAPGETAPCAGTNFDCAGDRKYNPGYQKKL
ncbi:MAG: hypothetical protein AAF518_15085 [Spirochaetota bacterium]